MAHRREIIAGIAVSGIAVTAAFWMTRGERFGPATSWRGQLAPSDPVQENLERPLTTWQGDAELTLFARFDVRALVLSVKRYRDADGDIMPYDLALGWGPASDPSLLAKVEIWQSGRWYRWRAKNLAEAPQGMERHSANMHIVPASGKVRGDLGRMRPGNLIEITGHLCDVAKPGRIIRSSRVRTDTGAGACEVVYAEEVKIIA